MSLLGNTSRIQEVESGESLDSLQFRERALHKAELLRQRGIGPGQRVILAHGNSVEFFCDLVATWLLRASAVPLHPSVTDRELVHAVADTGASLVIVAKDRASLGATPLLHTVTDFQGAPRVLKNASWPGDADECLILFSSGSSGRPKGVRHSWGGIRYRVEQIQRQIRPAEWENALCLLPTSFGHGLIGNCLAPWLAGKTLFLLRGFQPLAAPELPRILFENNIHFFSSVPSIWKVLEKCGPHRSLPSLYRVHCASAPLSRSMRRFIHEWCQGASTVNVYGITEAGSWIAGTPMTANEEPDGYVGAPWGVEVAVLTEGGRVTCDEGVTGELCVKSSSLMMGYVGDAEAERVGDYLRTGDLGYLDFRGHVVLVGRISDFINRGGIKVSPHEVRGCIEEHPAVEEAWVTGIDSEVWGQVVAAAVKPVDPARFAVDAVRAWTESQLSAPKRPSVWKVVDAIPKGANGKVDRARMKEILAADSAHSP